jgi:hypothetical protein
MSSPPRTWPLSMMSPCGRTGGGNNSGGEQERLPKAAHWADGNEELVGGEAWGGDLIWFGSSPYPGRFWMETNY